jgi:4-diphosphocytidyl-2-C-methyl-D-erythritol kinase
MRGWRVRAFAKINLSLQIVGRRADGYHELRTVFQSIALHDTLTIRRSAGAFELTCSDPRCPTDRTNLVCRAAEQVWKAAGRRGHPRGISVDLVKRIPVEAGLGGGSSDGAAAIRAFGALWRVDAARQLEIAAALGADVPYFLEGGTVLGLARGDLLFPLIDRPPGWVLIVVPAFGVSTREAFEWYGGQVRTPEGSGPVPAQVRTPEVSGPVPVNDLEPCVVRRHPPIARLINSLRKQRHALAAGMSGSGSAVFAIFAQRVDAERAAKRVDRADRQAPHRLVAVTRTLTRAAYQRLAATQRIG